MSDVGGTAAGAAADDDGDAPGTAAAALAWLGGEHVHVAVDRIQELEDQRRALEQQNKGVVKDLKTKSGSISG